MMSQSKINRSFLLVGVVFFVAMFLCVSAEAAETYHLRGDAGWQKLDGSTDGGQILAVARVKQLIAQGKRKEAATALKELQASYPEFSGEEGDALMAAELLLAKKKLVKSSRMFEEFLDAYPDSVFYETALERQFTIADMFIKGHKRRVLGIFRLSAYEEADNIMHEIADRTGDAPIAKRALTTLAKGYQKLKKYIEAYDAWAEISSKWPTGDLGREALLEMAHSLHSAYKGPKYDSSALISARSYYENFAARYPGYVDSYDIKEKIKLVDEQLAYKEYEVGEYYARAELGDAANLYYQHTSDSWPGTTASKMANEVIEQHRKGEKSKSEKKPVERIAFDKACVFLDNWFGLTGFGAKK